MIKNQVQNIMKFNGRRQHRKKEMAITLLGRTIIMKNNIPRMMSNRQYKYNTTWILLVFIISMKISYTDGDSNFHYYDDHQLHPRDGFKLSLTSPQDIVSTTRSGRSNVDKRPYQSSNNQYHHQNVNDSDSQLQRNLNDFPLTTEKNAKMKESYISNDHRHHHHPKIKQEEAAISTTTATKPKRIVWKDVTRSIIPSIRNSQTSIMRRLQKGRITCDFGSYIHDQPIQQRQYHRRRRQRQYNNNKNVHYNILQNTNTTTSTGTDANSTYSMSNPSQTKNTRNSNYNFSYLSTSCLTKLSSPSRSRISKKSILPKNQNAKIRITVDPSAIGRLGFILLFAATSFGSAFMGTLRLLAPLVVSRRILVFIGTLISDWYAGRYFRETFTRIEKLYMNYYETPATFRAISRSGSQFIVYLTLARIMGWLVGISHPPCRSEGRGLAFFCGLLWLGSVVGTGHAFSTAVALWGGPLRLQAANHPTKTSVKAILRRPWHILQWMQNPEQWISLLSIPERRPFDPNPIAFPVTWPILRLLQMVGVAIAASSEPADYLWCPSDQNQITKLMKQYLIQLALCDEWCRVFIKERRLGLGLFVACAYSIAMGTMMVTCVGMNSTAALLLLPSLLALIVSTWLNLVIYCNRYIRKRTRPVFTPINSL